LTKLESKISVVIICPGMGICMSVSVYVSYLRIRGNMLVPFWGFSRTFIVHICEGTCPLHRSQKLL
jgi:hypothetical protein